MNPSLAIRLRNFCLILIGIVAFVAMGEVLQDRFHIPFDTSYRIACALACLALIAKLGWDSAGETWPWSGLGLATLVNIALFFTPMRHQPASRGGILLFAMPDLVVVLAARIRDYPVADDHQRAVRQQLVVGLIIALALCSLVLATMFIPDHPRHRGQAANSLNAAATQHSG